MGGETDELSCHTALEHGYQYSAYEGDLKVSIWGDCSDFRFTNPREVQPQATWVDEVVPFINLTLILIASFSLFGDLSEYE